MERYKEIMEVIFGVDNEEELQQETDSIEGLQEEEAYNEGLQEQTHFDIQGFQEEIESEGLEEETNSVPDNSIVRKRKFTSNAQRRAIYEMLLGKSVNGKLGRMDTTIAAATFSIGIRTVERIWERGMLTGDVSSRKATNCGRKKVEVDLELIREMPLHTRTTIDSLACSLKIGKGKACNLVKEGEIKRTSNAIKPFLKDANKRSRLQFCLSMLEESSLPNDPTFKAMHNIIHIDEKWFDMTKKSQNYYLLLDEEEPLRTCKSKNFIPKVMFLAAIARPRFDAHGTEVFSRKIGVFPLVTHEPAKRSSVNKVAGTMETKPITSVTRDVIRSFMIEKVLPVIKEKWPREEMMNPIIIQQDNAKTHIDCDDVEFCKAARRYGLDIRSMCQPANSPDLNVLDLGFFSAIQSLQRKENPRTIDELVNAVVNSFNNFPVVKSNHIFLSLQLSMIKIMEAKGGNDYKLQHIGKQKLERAGKPPLQLKCDAALVQEVLQFLN